MVSSDKIYDLLKQVFLILNAGDQHLFGLFGLTVTRYYILYHIAEQPGSTLSELSTRMLCDKSNVTRLVKGLESKGFIARKTHESDKRSIRLYLTPSGKTIEQQARVAHSAYNQMRLQNAQPITTAHQFEATLQTLLEILGSELVQMTSVSAEQLLRIERTTL